nr:MAG TPA: hypothetical protein [Caudoviricetes sp.]
MNGCCILRLRAYNNKHRNGERTPHRTERKAS